MVATKAEADIVIAELNQGADFVALAEARADGPTGPNGGAAGLADGSITCPRPSPQR